MRLAGLAWLVVTSSEASAFLNNLYIVHPKIAYILNCIRLFGGGLICGTL